MGTGAVLPLVSASLVSRGIVPADLRASQPTVEDVFLSIVGQEPGD